MAEEVVIEDGKPYKANETNESHKTNGPAAPQQPVMGCTGDCRRCHEIQRGYCASQIAYNMQNAVARVEAVMATMAQTIVALTSKVEALQSQLEAQKKDTAQLDFFAPEPEKPAKPSRNKK